jgi:hypothetical protein
MKNWIDGLRELRLGGAEKVPGGWLTIEELQPIFDVKIAQTYKLVEALCKSQKAEKRKFRIQCGSMVRGKFHYKMK